MGSSDRAASFEAMARKVGPRALSVAWSLLGSEAAAEDAVQEAFERAYRALESFRGEAQMRTWFLRIVVNTAHRHGRRQGRDPLGRAVALDDISMPADACQSPEKSWESRRLRQRLASAISRLPRRQRTAFVLRHMEGFDTEEAAEIMGCAQGTVKASLFKAVRRLRRELRPLLPGAPQ